MWFMQSPPQYECENEGNDRLAQSWSTTSALLLSVTTLTNLLSHVSQFFSRQRQSASTDDFKSAFTKADDCLFS